jgi:hypothetical protein
MTRAEIIAELRRSALHDNNPFLRCSPSAYYAAVNMRTLEDAVSNEADRILWHRVFFLFVAAAMEGEA